MSGHQLKPEEGVFPLVPWDWPLGVTVTADKWVGQCINQAARKAKLKGNVSKRHSGLVWTVRLILCVHEGHRPQPGYKLSLSEVQTFIVEASKYLPWLQKAAVSFIEGSGL